MCFLWLTSDDRFDLSAFEKGDHSVAPVPDAVARAPDFVGLDLAAAGQEDDGFAATSRTDAWSTGGNRIDAGGRV